MNLLTIAGFVTSLFSIGSWISEIFHWLLLFIDGIVYTLLSYSFRLFQLMCTLNFNSLYGMISGVLTRIEALIMVFTVYKLGISLITYMLKPEEAAKKGKEVLINIFVTAALLLGYNTIFTLFNELSMLIIGTPENYNYVVLGEIAEITGGKDAGLINRVVFGTEEEIPDIGDHIAFSICSSFITYSQDPQNTVPLKTVLSKNGKIDFNKLTDLDSRIGKDFEMFYVVGFAAACYMIYSFVKTTVQVGVRAFKLLILQIIAPVAIITIIGEGIKGKTFHNFINKYISVYIEVFIRMFSMLLICNFVVKFIANIFDYFPTIDADEWYTVAIMVILIIGAAFKFVGDIPKFIDEILDTHLDSGNKDGFGGFLKGLFGGVAGGLSGFIGGFAGGGLGGAIAGFGSGMLSGASSGAKGKNIADFFKGQVQAGSTAKTKGQNIAARGGLFQSTLGGIERGLGRGNSQDRSLAKIDRRSSALDELEAAEKFAVKDKKMDATDMVLGSTAGTTAAASSMYSYGYDGVKLGEDKDAYASKMLQYDLEYQKAQAKYDRTKSDADKTTADEARAKAEERAKAYYDTAKENAGNNSDDVKAKRKAYMAAGGTSTKGADRTKERQAIHEERTNITNSRSYSRTHYQNPNSK